MEESKNESGSAPTIPCAWPSGCRRGSNFIASCTASSLESDWRPCASRQSKRRSERVVHQRPRPRAARLPHSLTAAASLCFCPSVSSPYRLLMAKTRQRPLIVHKVPVYDGHRGRVTQFIIQARLCLVSFFRLSLLAVGVAADYYLLCLSSLPSVTPMRKHYGFYGRCLK